MPRSFFLWQENISCMLCLIGRIPSFDRKFAALSQICAKTAWITAKISCESEDFVGAWLPGSRLISHPGPSLSRYIKFRHFFNWKIFWQSRRLWTFPQFCTVLETKLFLGLLQLVIVKHQNEKSLIEGCTSWGWAVPSSAQLSLKPLAWNFALAGAGAAYSASFGKNWELVTH